MEFLKDILGEELFKQVTSKINEFNGNEANAQKKIKLANLETGDYIGKGKYTSLEEQLKSVIAERDEGKKLIETLQKGTKGNEELQGKITAYENQIKQMQEQYAKEKLVTAIKLSLMSAKATDIDYLTYKLQSQGTELKLNENGEIDGINDIIKNMKTQYPNFFEGSATRTYNENPLPPHDPNNDKGGYTKENLMKLSVSERAKMQEADPQAYEQAFK